MLLGPVDPKSGPENENNESFESRSLSAGLNSSLVVNSFMEVIYVSLTCYSHSFIDHYWALCLCSFGSCSQISRSTARNGLSRPMLNIATPNSEGWHMLKSDPSGVAFARNGNARAKASQRRLLYLIRLRLIHRRNLKLSSSRVQREMQKQKDSVPVSLRINLPLLAVTRAFRWRIFRGPAGKDRTE